MPTRSDYYVYILFRETGIPFYVGKGRGDRWTQHKYEAARTGYSLTHRHRIVAAMLAEGKEIPMVKLHEGLTEAIAHAYEVALIAAIGRKPYGPLVNHTDGGEGASGAVRSAEVRELVAAKLRGKKRPPEVGAKIRVKATGRKMAPEAVAKQAAKMRGRKASDETKAKMSESRRGHRVTSDTRHKLRQRMTGRNIPAEWREKISAQFLGRQQDPVVVAKRLAAQAKAFERRRQRKAIALMLILLAAPVQRELALEASQD